MSFFSNVYDSWKQIQFEKYKQMLPMLQEMNLASTLDVGAGSGFFEEFLEENGFSTGGFVCVEPDKKMFKACGFRNKILCSAEKLPFENERFDSLVCLDTIHLITDAKDMSRVLKNNGKMLVSLFCNKDNVDEKEKMILEKLKGFKVLEKKLVPGKELELVMLVEKR
ncbi:MAG: class I SAM-dependent methyltransferase [Candidatus Aenigmatarchaeota archaeon]